MKKVNTAIVTDNKPVVKGKAKVEKVKVAGGFELSNNIPIPEDINSRKGIKGAFRKTVEVMKIGQCFDADIVPKHRYIIQKKLNIKLATKKLPSGKTRVWRVS